MRFVVILGIVRPKAGNAFVLILATAIINRQLTSTYWFKAHVDFSGGSG